jgi:hypothetical protein
MQKRAVAGLDEPAAEKSLEARTQHRDARR